MEGVTPDLLYLSDLVCPLFFVNLATFFSFGCHPLLEGAHYIECLVKAHSDRLVYQQVQMQTVKRRRPIFCVSRWHKAHIYRECLVKWPGLYKFSFLRLFLTFTSSHDKIIKAYLPENPSKFTSMTPIKNPTSRHHLLKAEAYAHLLLYDSGEDLWRFAGFGRTRPLRQRCFKNVNAFSRDKRQSDKISTF